MADSFVVVFAIYPRVTQLDFTGPHEVLWRMPGARCILASSAGGDVEADGGSSSPTCNASPTSSAATSSACRRLRHDRGDGGPRAVDPLRRLASGARYVTSVCTGSLVLGAAGLLKGKRAASHWAWRHALASFGAIPDPSRVVRDGNLFHRRRRHRRASTSH
jgi:transcriptional regulator GlxA family with amidase domain